MRRQRRGRHYADDDTLPSGYNNFNGSDNEIVKMGNMLPRSKMLHNIGNIIEANVHEGDTLQALALRFHCTVADIRRLNKIDKDNEIHAHKVIKIPLTVHSVLLETLPIVHKSGNCSPRYPSVLEEDTLSNTAQGSLQDAKVELEEKLLVASVNAAGNTIEIKPHSLNETILSSKQSLSETITKSDPQRQSVSSTDDMNTDITTPLLGNLLDENIPHPRPIRGPALSAIDWSGSDCDMSWVCLFVFILALCFAIPLLYVLYLAEHQHTHHSNVTTH